MLPLQHTKFLCPVIYVKRISMERESPREREGERKKQEREKELRKEKWMGKEMEEEGKETKRSVRR